MATYVYEDQSHQKKVATVEESSWAFCVKMADGSQGWWCRTWKEAKAYLEERVGDLTGRVVHWAG